MPEMNGIEVAKWVKDHCPNTRIVLFSGQSAARNLLDRARAQGYDFELLSKPIHPNLLLQRLRNSPR
jgi:CheY-like chemotaxis protein